MDLDRHIDIDEVLKLLPKNISVMRMKIEEGLKKIAELEEKEKYIIKNLIKVQLLRKRENEASLIASQESLNCLLQKLNKRKTFSETVMKNINQKRNKALLKDEQPDQDAAQNHAETTKGVMDKIKEQTEIVENQSVIKKRTHVYKESTKHFHSKNNELKLDTANKKNELDYVLDIYSGLNQIYQNFHKNNIILDLELKELDEKIFSLQSKIDSLSHDTHKLSSN